jgi:hypothetical protein
VSYHGLVILTIFAFGVLGIWALWDWLWERQRRRK